MKKQISILLAFSILLVAALFSVSCGSSAVGEAIDTEELFRILSTKKGCRIAVPNDPTNEARALLLLEANGIIKLRENAGISATKADIIENPYGIELMELEAAQLPLKLSDVDFAVINSNYAIPAGLNPTKNAILLENAYSVYSNILAVRAADVATDKTKALVAALNSKQIADFLINEYQGAVISVVENPGDGYDATVDYEALKGQTITVAASPTPHAEILEQVKRILAEKDITLKISVMTNYVQPNRVVENGDCDANYFQHAPYLENFNAENGTHLVSAAAIHVEPMGLYRGR